MKQLASLFIVFLGVFDSAAHAKTRFQNFSLTVLHGSNYEVGAAERTVMTTEYLNVSSWGDLFVFSDRLRSDNGDTETYTEFQPRFNLLKLSDTSLVKKLTFATQWEMSENADNYLAGVGVDFNVAGFQYLKLNAYRRFNDSTDDNWQLSPVWAVPFKLGSTTWLFDGFLDWSTSNDQLASIINFVPQIKMDFSSYAGLDSPLYIGIEYVYWKNKFGIKSVDEKNPNLFVKVHF